MRHSQHLGQSADILQARVQPLTRDGMHAVRGVAHQRHAWGGKAVGDRQRQRIGKPNAGQRYRSQEVADAVAYLASPAASYITGVALPVDGGLLTVG